MEIFWSRRHVIFYLLFFLKAFSWWPLFFFCLSLPIFSQWKCSNSWQFCWSPALVICVTAVLQLNAWSLAQGKQISFMGKQKFCLGCSIGQVNLPEDLKFNYKISKRIYCSCWMNLKCKYQNNSKNCNANCFPQYTLRYWIDVTVHLVFLFLKIHVLWALYILHSKFNNWSEIMATVFRISYFLAQACHSLKQ